jgi:hypothetical protein
MTNPIMLNLVPLRGKPAPRPVVYSHPERCLCGASIDLELDSGTLVIARIRIADGSRRYRIVSCDMCPRD